MKNLSILRKTSFSIIFLLVALLLEEAYSILNRKQKDYFAKFKHEIIGIPITNSNFTYLFPVTQYQNYSAYESSDFDVVRGNYNNDYYIKKLERKGKTFYYEGANHAGYDKIINDENSEIGIHYIVNLSVKYDFKKKQINFHQVKTSIHQVCKISVFIRGNFTLEI